MNHPIAIILNDRSVIRLSGPDARDLLQGIITNDIHKLAEGAPLYAALLSPQGKYLFDFVLFQLGDDILMDVEAARKDELLRKLMMYKLRADVDITDVSDAHRVWAVLSGTEGDDDPRHASLGKRVILPAGEAPEGKTGQMADYEALLISLGIPNASTDLEVDKRPILEANLEELNGVSFTKGCYVGQEVTARMKHRNAVRKRLFALAFDGPAPETGSTLESDGKKAGQIIAMHGDMAMALVRMEYVEKVLTCDGRKAEFVIPDYMEPVIKALDENENSPS